MVLPIPLWLHNRARGGIDCLLLGSVPAAMDFMRTQVADGATTAFGPDGVMSYYNANQPRFDHDPLTGAALGLLYEAQRMNILANATLQGGTVGTSTLPTGYAVESSAGLTTTLVGKGSENGIPYMDLRISGTPTGTFYKLRTSSVNGPALGETWSVSSYLKRSGGSPTNVSYVSSYVIEAGGSYAGVSCGPIDLESQRLIRYSGARVWASSYGAQYRIQLGLSVGLPVDITVRIAAPQVERGAEASSFIPTTGSAVTRAQDVLSLTIPESVAFLRYTFDDDSTQDVAVPAGLYTVPTNLNRARIKRITSLRG